jgi:hypothetical protein
MVGRRVSDRPRGDGLLLVSAKQKPCDPVHFRRVHDLIVGKVSALSVLLAAA